MNNIMHDCSIDLLIIQCNNDTAVKSRHVIDRVGLESNGLG
jgi:hypothetical protein